MPIDWAGNARYISSRIPHPRQAYSPCFAGISLRARTCYRGTMVPPRVERGVRQNLSETSLLGSGQHNNQRARAVVSLPRRAIYAYLHHRLKSTTADRFRKSIQDSGFAGHHSGCRRRTCSPPPTIGPWHQMCALRRTTGGTSPQSSGPVCARPPFEGSGTTRRKRVRSSISVPDTVRNVPANTYWCHNSRHYSNSLLECARSFQGM